MQEELLRLWMVFGLKEIKISAMLCFHLLAFHKHKTYRRCIYPNLPEPIKCCAK